jgi:hypothetical protein
MTTELAPFDPSLIDALGKLKAQIADLQKQEEVLKRAIIESGVTAEEGELFRVTVTNAVRETLDMEAVREKLSPQFIRAHTKETFYTTVRVTARKSDSK